MATIKISGPHSDVVMSEPDEDGDYSWDCKDCGAQCDAWRPVDEALHEAEIHVDFRCRRIPVPS